MLITKEKYTWGKNLDSIFIALEHSDYRHRADRYWECEHPEQWIMSSKIVFCQSFLPEHVPWGPKGHQSPGRRWSRWPYRARCSCPVSRCRTRTCRWTSACSSGACVWPGLWWSQNTFYETNILNKCIICQCFNTQTCNCHKSECPEHCKSLRPRDQSLHPWPCQCQCWI